MIPKSKLRKRIISNEKDYNSHFIDDILLSYETKQFYSFIYNLV